MPMDDQLDISDTSVTPFKLVFECATALRTLADVMANLQLAVV